MRWIQSKEHCGASLGIQGVDSGPCSLLGSHVVLVHNLNSWSLSFLICKRVDGSEVLLVLGCCDVSVEVSSIAHAQDFSGSGKSVTWKACIFYLIKNLMCLFFFLPKHLFVTFKVQNQIHRSRYMNHIYIPIYLLFRPT